MKVNLFQLSCLLCFFLSGCVQEINLTFPMDEPKVVIEGLLTDEIIEKDANKYYLPARTAKYVRLTYSNPINIYRADMESNNRPIRNAMVVIKDDFGQTDTLKADSSEWEPFIGYYTARKLKCLPGRSYHLDVWIGKDHYYSSAYMPVVARIDSVSTTYIERPIEKFSGYSPLLYFKDISPLENYYIAKVSGATDDPNAPPIISYFTADFGSRTWNFAILNDKFLQSSVEGVSIQLGATSSTYYTVSLEPDYNYNACLFSLTKEAYDYYSVLIRSLQNDGGAYSPTPASPPGNIKGGALGFFNASAASIKRFKVKE